MYQLILIQTYLNEGYPLNSSAYHVDIEGNRFLDEKIQKLIAKPDISSARYMSWLNDKSVLVFSDILNSDGSYSHFSPRNILKRKINELKNEGYQINAASELEFYLYSKTYSENVTRGIHNIKTIGSHVEDYLLQQGDRFENIMEQFRCKLKDSGITIESTKGEAAVGQHEINMTYSDILNQADNALVLKTVLTMFIN